VKSYTISEYISAGCNEMNIPSMLAVHGITNGKVCDTGCSRFNGGNCPAYKDLVKSKLVVGPPHNSQYETVRQEASRRGISISQVRKERRKEVEK
jgi:hypothetical protein